MTSTAGFELRASSNEESSYILEGEYGVLSSSSFFIGSLFVSARCFELIGGGVRSPNPISTLFFFRCRPSVSFDEERCLLKVTSALMRVTGEEWLECRDILLLLLWTITPSIMSLLPTGRPVEEGEGGGDSEIDTILHTAYPRMLSSWLYASMS